ncbi:RagB/SusD family nutrient uptake outer membrane protein [Chitinophaga sp. 22620]|uniref:RagB/SusD family nutrient uptake outer membrane protein n=1 Tax=Chitinophaga sp. 22620 TaxID=3453952 RepID=UPI003F8637E8
MKINKIQIFLILFLLTSCSKDWLDEKSDGKLAVPTTLADLQGMMDDTETMNINTSDKGEIASDGHYITTETFMTAEENDSKDAYIWRKTLRYTADDGLQWASAYRKVLYCNTVLDALSKFQPKNSSEQTESDHIKGQALFQRSFEFFHLSQLYTPPLSNENKDSELGILMRLNSDITSPTHRSTVKETFDQIISDLTGAAALLPERPKTLTRASKTAAYALLARVNLYLGNYSEALAYSDNCLKLYSNLLNFNNLTPGQGFIGLYNTEVLFHASFSGTGYLTYNCIIDSNLVNLYNENDLRKTTLFLKNTTTEGYSFQGNYNNLPDPIFCGLAVDEIYLIRAECYTRIGKISEAMADINTLLKSRWEASAVYLPITAANTEDALSIILRERQKSLILRGTRWMDLRRLNLEAQFRVTLKRKIGDNEYTLEPNSYKYAFPLPDDIVEQTGVRQNPGWN